MARFFTLALAVAGWLSCPALADCPRDKLLATTDAYVTSQNSGDLASLQKLFSSSNFTYQENNKVEDVKSGLLSKTLKIDYNRSTADTTACVSYTEVVVTSPIPYVIGTQIRHNADMSVSMVDTVAATTGSLFFNASQSLEYFKKQDWSPLPEGKRPTRDVLQAAIDGYLDLWSNSTAINSIPFGTPCERVEGSRYVTPCTNGVPTSGGMKANSMRRYVIDEVIGSAEVLCSFTSVGDIPDSHEIRIENGKTRYVVTITLPWIQSGGKGKKGGASGIGGGATSRIKPQLGI
ncbi:hypothetical protein GQ53DRAFT_655006 [Thozetella sp. PMI_491]|nr:hypothetical protein GQ53DRAFT_655006 [Thozetella sp. PMI_491]